MSSSQYVTFDPSVYIEIATQVLGMMREHPSLGRILEEKGKRGGFLCVGDLAGHPRLIVQIGECEAAKLPKYLELCQEKVRRLASHPAHFLSRESEDEALDRYPGAVRGLERLYGFSGLPGHADELLSMGVATRTLDMTRSMAMSILKTFPNKYAAGSETDVIYL